MPDKPANAGFTIGGELSVGRVGLGTLELAGRYGWGLTPHIEQARATLRRALELGVNVIDTSDAYGPGVSEQAIASTLYPYPDDLRFATKGGLVRFGPNIEDERCDGRPEHLREACEASLRRLRVDRIDLYQLHFVDPEVPVEESVGALSELVAEGKIRHIGMSNIDATQLQRAQATAPIASVQNRYNILRRESEDILEICARDGLTFIPWSPLAGGVLARESSPVARLAADHRVTPAQFALAWLMARSPSILLIPGTPFVAELEDNLGALTVKLSASEIAAVEELTQDQ
jgi:aryl-alcohol dehydrogenase-like predicted oxidoreductase